MEQRSGMGLWTSRTRNGRANPDITAFRTHGFPMTEIYRRLDNKVYKVEHMALRKMKVHNQHGLA